MEKPVAVRPFVDTLREIRNGQCLEELGFHLNDLVAAVRNTGRAGEIVLKIKVIPAGSGRVEAVEVKDDIIQKLPQLPKKSTLFFPTEDNNLQRTDPRQRTMELEEVPKTGGKTLEAKTA